MAPAVALMGSPACNPLLGWLGAVCSLAGPSSCLRSCCQLIRRDTGWQLAGLLLLHLKIPYRENEPNGAGASDRGSRLVYCELAGKCTTSLRSA